MAPKRIFAFDVLRVVSILGILLCHSCFLWGGFDWLGRYCAQTFNLIFLLLSAFLLGMKWEEEEFPQYNVKFVWRRIKKLMVVFYPFLVIAMTVLYALGFHPPLQVVVSQFLFLSWFQPLICFGQLWYLTMIAICYCLCFVISHAPILRELLRGEKGWLPFTLTLLCSIGLMSIQVEARNIGGIFFYCTLYALVFTNASKILVLIRRLPSTYWIVITLIINIGALCLYYDNLFARRLLSYAVSTLTAISISGLVISLFSFDSHNKLITWFAGLSFEVYLVHEFFLGPICVYKYFNHFVGYLVLIGLSVIAGLILKRICESVKKLLC